jgi:predicted phage terminase large subunit-like protein
MKVDPKLFDIEAMKKVSARMSYSFYLEMVHYGKYRPARHHDLICNKLQQILDGKLKRLMVFMPPRHGKSQTITESFPSYFNGKFPNKRAIVVSYGDELARDFGRKNKQKIDDFGKELFNIELDKSNHSATNYSIKEHTGGAFYTGIMGGITGRGADLLIIDDPIKTRMEAESETYRNRVYEEYQSSLTTRLMPNGAIIIILTRWHYDDLAGRILEKEGRIEDGGIWDVINLPCEAEENDPLGREIGEPLWSEFGYNEEWIKEKKIAVGSRTWFSLYQQRPSPDSGDIFKRQWIKYYRALPELDEQIISVDATFKDKKTSDFVVMQCWGRKGADKYLIDQVRDRMSFTSTLNSLRAFCAKHLNAHTKLIEDKANGTAVIDTLKREISGMIPIDPQGGKETRANAVSPQWEAGNVYLPDPSICPWVNDFVEELLHFPNGKHDDQVDGMTQALARWENSQPFLIGRA